MFGWFSKKVKWSERKPKVIVVGAGLSGLVASLELAEAGVDLIVLDKEPQVGGRVYSEPLGGTHVNLGAQYFFECDNALLNRYISRVAKFKMERGLLGALWDGTLAASTDGEKLLLKLPVEHKALEDLDTGKGVTINTPDRPIYWYRPDPSAMYTVIYADLSVKQVPAADLPKVPDSSEEAKESATP
jgi:hypothetical protein